MKTKSHTHADEFRNQWRTYPDKHSMNMVSEGVKFHCSVKSKVCILVLREPMESLVPGVSRVCLDRREMKVPEVSLDHLVQSVCRFVP